MTDIRPKNRILNYTAVIVGIILCVELFAMVTHVDSLDNIVLLEDRDPGYWNHLSPDKAEQLSIPTDLNNISYVDILNNNLLNNYTLTSGEYDGFTLSNDGRSVVINGTVKEDTWIALINEPFKLDTGIYYISLNEDSNSFDDSIYAYLNGQKDGQNVDWIGDIKEDLFYKVNDPLDNYMISIKLSTGKKFHDTSITPVVSKVSDSPNNDNENIRIWHVQTRLLDSLSNKDKKLLYRNISSQQNQYAWQSIVYEDRSGIQFIPIIGNNGVKGTIDVFGRVDGQE